VGDSEIVDFYIEIVHKKVKHGIHLQCIAYIPRDLQQYVISASNRIGHFSESQKDELKYSKLQSHNYDKRIVAM